MKYDYLYATNRQIDINGIPPEEIDDCFKALIDSLSLEWLEQNDGNIVQHLWKQKYHLATVELFCLGHALRSFAGTHPKFVKEKVELIKSKDNKAWNGAFFELLALDAFNNFYNVIPAKVNQPGYDGSIEIAADHKIRLSIKNYSISRHHDSFNTECSKIKDLTEKYLQQFDMVPVEIVLNKKSTYPSKDDWENLSSNFHGVFVEYKARGKKFFMANIGDWSIIVQELLAEVYPYSSNPKSYTLIMSAPFHRNEEKNLFDKLEEACVNIVKHEGQETDTEKNFVIIHLPKIASRKNCTEWVKDYFNLYPAKPLSGVILLQPLVIKDDQQNVNYVSIGISVVVRDKFSKDFSKHLPINIKYPLGRLEGNYPGHAIFLRETDKTAIKIELEDSYVYQHGNHYHDAVMKEDGGLEGVLSKIASGIFTHSVFNIMGQAMTISGQYEPVDQLDII